MSNATMKASGRLEKGIVAAPEKSFLKGIKQPSRFQQKYTVRGNQDLSGASTRSDSKKADPYDYGFDEMPI